VLDRHQAGQPILGAHRGHGGNTFIDPTLADSAVMVMTDAVSEYVLHLCPFAGLPSGFRHPTAVAVKPRQGVGGPPSEFSPTRLSDQRCARSPAGRSRLATAKAPCLLGGAPADTATVALPRQVVIAKSCRSHPLSRGSGPTCRLKAGDVWTQSASIPYDLSHVGSIGLVR